MRKIVCATQFAESRTVTAEGLTIDFGDGLREHVYRRDDSSVDLPPLASLTGLTGLRMGMAERTIVVFSWTDSGEAHSKNQPVTL